jgi:hypothetical protein
MLQYLYHDCLLTNIHTVKEVQALARVMIFGFFFCQNFKADIIAGDFFCSTFCIPFTEFQTHTNLVPDATEGSRCGFDGRVSGVRVSGVVRRRPASPAPSTRMT